MSGTASTKECYKCNHRFSVTDLKSKKVTVNSGRSGVSHTWNNKSNGLSTHTGRKYYRNKIVYLCDDCRTFFDDVSIFLDKIYAAIDLIFTFIIRLAFFGIVIFGAWLIYLELSS